MSVPANKKIRTARAMRAIAAAALLMGGAPALAQRIGDPPPKLTPMQQEAEDAKKEHARADREYRATVKRIQGTEQQAVENDPWRNVRPLDAKAGKR
jgi:hypothetical protein